MHDKRGADHQAYLWQYGKPGGETVFDSRMGRGREGPQKFLGQWAGTLQTDGYQAYDGVGGPKLVHVGCWTHARRKFVDAVKVNRDDAAAVQMVMRMDALFLVDRDAREKQMTLEERLALRRQHAEIWAQEIRKEHANLALTGLPQSALGRAVGYTLNLCPKLRRCSTTRKWSCRTIWRRTLFNRWHWDARTGCMWGASRRARRWPHSLYRRVFPTVRCTSTRVSAGGAAGPASLQDV
jgi:hypothetical protein